MYYPLPINALGALFTGHDPVVLLDTARPGPAERRSFLFLEPSEILTAPDLTAVDGLMEGLVRHEHDRWLAGYLCYEAAYAWHARLGNAGPGPYGWFGVYERPHIFDHERGDWDRPPPGLESGCVPSVAADAPEFRPRIDERRYRQQLAAIRTYLARGDTYQVNFTFDGELQSTLDAWALYVHLRAAQPVAYSAFIRHGDMCILSYSPELFFRSEAGYIYTRPMKGTAPRGRTWEEDRVLRTRLAADIKSCTENVIIVDLLRNDLGRICTTGSVHVPELFAVEAHRTVLQMTSTVAGTLRPEITLAGILRALFPCGSVTGAPKHRTLELIAELEEGPRGAYCGAIGYSAPTGERTFSVPIRTLQRAGVTGPWRYRVGSGIVWDSDPGAEWHECLTKCAFLTTPAPRFELLETLRLDADFAYCDQHRERLTRSAAFWGYPFDTREWERLMKEIRTQRRRVGPLRVRVLLDENGRLRWEDAPLAAVPSTAPLPVAHSPTCVDETEPLLYFKSTHRPWYAAAAESIKRAGLFDMLFTNTRGELTEGTRSNLFVALAGRLYTPPVTSGLLPGVLRESLLRQRRCEERVLRPEDLEHADGLYCGNSVHGLVRVRLDDAPLYNPRPPSLV